MDLDIVPRLSSRDKEALNAFLPDYVSSESLGTVNQLKAKAQIETLRGLAADLDKEIPREHPEKWLRENNEERPHESLGNKTPREFLLSHNPEISTYGW
jgi:transposase InsO family protein